MVKWVVQLPQEMMNLTKSDGKTASHCMLHRILIQMNPMSTAQRWNKYTQAKIAVPQPFLIDQYKKVTGGLGRANQHIIISNITSQLKPKSGGGHSLFGFQA